MKIFIFFSFFFIFAKKVTKMQSKSVCTIPPERSSALYKNIKATKDPEIKISVIVAVYNHFEWLRLILDTLRMQTFRQFEVVIADDGSNEETVGKIRNYISAYPELKVKHVRQEDKGWRKNLCLNEAVKASDGDYLVFIDGDCVPHRKFVEDHYRLRRQGIVTGGRRVESEAPLSDMLERMDTLPKNFFCLARLKVLASIFRSPFGKTMAQLRRMWRWPFIFGHAFGCKNQGILGANFGIFRDDLMRVNGFDERYVNPGTGEDCDLDARLENAGVHHVKYSHYALMIHRHHNRLFWGAPENAELLRRAIDEKITYTPYGICK